MEKVSQFVVDNWQWLCSVVLATGIFILQLIKKKPKAESVIDYIYQVIADDLPSLICLAEDKGFCGPDKLLFVVSHAISILKNKVELDEAAEEKARRVFSYAVEKILETPEKK